MKFSVIVPVYKTEPYLEQCVSSILHQSFRDFELLLIDDGSPDHCPLMCDAFAQADSRVSVIHQSNKGLSAARNVAIDAARGEYLVFVDSDDWIEEDALYYFNEAITSHPCDILLTIKTTVQDEVRYPEVTGLDEYVKEGFDRNRALHWMLDLSKSVAASNKIVNRAFVNKNNLRFKEGIYHEDTDWQAKLCIYGEVFWGIDIAWYNYRLTRPGSITYAPKCKHVKDLIDTARDYYEQAVLNNTERYIIAYHMCMRHLFSAICLVSSMTEDDFNQVCDYVNRNRDLFSYAPSMKHKLFVVTFKAFGAKPALTILRILRT